jgi:hypothetical protein
MFLKVDYLNLVTLHRQSSFFIEYSTYFQKLESMRHWVY